MESKTNPKKKGFNIFDDDDESDEAHTAPKLGSQVQAQQPVHTVPTNNNTSVAASKPEASSIAGQPTRSFVSRPTTSAAAYARKAMAFSNLGQPTPTFGSSATIKNDSGNKNTSWFGRQCQRTDLRGMFRRDKEYDEEDQVFIDSPPGSPHQQQTFMPCANDASTAAGVEQLCPIVAETRPAGVSNVSTSVQTAADEQPVKTPMTVQQQQSRPVIHIKYLSGTMATVEQPSVPTDNLGLALIALPDKDFVFKVKYDQVPIHKIVLGARSYYFYQQFYENSESKRTFENVDEFDKEVVELAVRACYGQSFDETTLDNRITKQLIKFAGIYGMSCVKNLLQQTLANHITEETICSVALLSCETGDAQLREKCAAFVSTLILHNKSTPPGIETLPADFHKEIVLSIVAKNKKQ